MIDPAILNDSDLDTLEKQVLFLALSQFAEDSGCVILDYRAIRKGAFCFCPSITTEKVAQMIDELVQAEMLWPYEAAGVRCAYIPIFQVWNSSRTRQNQPDVVPIPTGIIYEPFEAERRKGSGIYHYPPTKNDLVVSWYIGNDASVTDEDIEF